MARASAVVGEEIDKEQFALAIARNQVGEKLPIADVMKSQGISEHLAEQYFNDPTFVKHVKRLAQELTENGFGFEAKARVLAEDALKTVYGIVTDKDAPTAVRMKGVENLVEWGGLKPKAAGGNNPNAQAGFTIQIVIPQAVQNAAIAEGVRDAQKITKTVTQDGELVGEDD